MTLTEIRERVEGTSLTTEDGHDPHLVDTLHPVHDRLLYTETVASLEQPPEDDISWEDLREELLS